MTAAPDARGSTRRAAIASASAAAALALAPRAFASDADKGPLDALAAYHAEVVDQYDALIAKAHDSERQSLQALRRRAAGAAAALPGPPPLPPLANTTLETLIAAEEALVAGCYTALQSLMQARHLKGCAAFMTDAGRRLVVLRKLAGQPLVPRAFETGIT
jgi:hypothetical protein